MDNKIADFTVHGNGVHGCQRHKRDIMIGFRIEGSPDFNDIFFTTEQARALVEKLNKKLKENEEE